MKTSIISIMTVMAMVAMASCGNNVSKSTNGNSTEVSNVVISDTVPYIVANHYFLKNDLKELPPEKITSQEEFDKFFGMAAVMGNGGQPTEIDFSKQFVIDIASTSTDYDTKLIPLTLKEENDSLIFKYRFTEGEKRTYSIQPLLLLVVDRRYDKPLKCLMVRE